MSPNSCYAESSLAEAMVALAGYAPPSLIALRALARVDFAEGWGTDDLSEALKLTNDLEQRLKTEIAKRNATPHWEDTFLRWWRDHRINPIKFYDLTLAFAIRLPGKRIPLAKAREHALLMLRPDLFVQQGVICQPDSTPSKNVKESTSHLAGQMRKERQALSKKLKDMMWNPRSKAARSAALNIHFMRLLPMTRQPRFLRQNCRESIGGLLRLTG